MWIPKLFWVSLVLLAFLIVPTPGNQASAQSPPDVLNKLGLASLAKRYCSGLYVSERGAKEALRNSVLISDSLNEQYDRDDLQFHIDEARKIIVAKSDGISSHARHFGDQGCVILPDGTDSPFFTPRDVISTLPVGSNQPWPMGDKLPADPLSSDVDQEMLKRAVDIFFSEPKDRRAAFLVVFGGRLIAERYGSGAHQNMQLESWSMGKSMTATLAGRLIQMGHFGLWDPAPVPRWQNPMGDPRAKIRVADLLRMSSGLKFTGGGDDETVLATSVIPGFADHGLGYAAPIDIFQYSTSRPNEFAPNTVGRYRNSDPWVLGAIVRQTVEGLGEDYLTWPQHHLFDKIGIRRFVMETDTYGNFILTGYNFGTPRDWARFGMLYLQDGIWNGERLLPEGFANFVSTPAPAWDPPVYGGLFWVNTHDPSVPAGHTSRIFTLPEDAYYAAGSHTQRVYIIPSRDLVIVTMSHRRGRTLSPDRAERMFEALGLTVKAIDPTWTWKTEPILQPMPE